MYNAYLKIFNILILEWIFEKNLFKMHSGIIYNNE